MSTLAETIRDALARLGPQAESRLREIVAELVSLDLCEEDRLSVLATSLAAVAATHHARHTSVYLDAVQTWSLEISVGLAPPPVRLSRLSGHGLIEEGAEIIIGGLDGLLEMVASDAVPLQDRLVLELALFAQFLGRHEANAIHCTLIAVSEALAEEDYRPGRAVRVPLGDRVVPLDRDASLASVTPHGVA
jgi:hypothetical protein